MSKRKVTVNSIKRWSTKHIENQHNALGNAIYVALRKCYSKEDADYIFYNFIGLHDLLKEREDKQ